MNELSLFTGAGGGLLGTKLLGWRPVGYVENDEYCQKVIAQRIRDDLLEEAPLFGDIRAFIGEGYARAYQGMVDVITAGFPCQPFSVAGKRFAEQDDRNLWPETRSTIQIVRPSLVFLENVPGLLSHEYSITIFRQLAEDGYRALPPIRMGADDVGANHKRKRIWIVAYYKGKSLEESALVEAPWAVSEPGKHLFGHPRGVRAPDWQTHQPSMVGMVCGGSDWVDRVRALGNGQIPAVVAAGSVSSR
jgi:DNA (cytosine-5)-methyltransferase 1